MSNEQSRDQSEHADCLHQLRGILKGFIELGNRMIAALISFKPSDDADRELKEFHDIVGCLVYLLQGAAASCVSLNLISSKHELGLRDCYVIARSIIETHVNVCYFAACGPSAADEARKHTSQKAFRDFDRESRIGRSVIRVRLTKPPPTPPEIEAWKKDFTSRTGREKGWTDLSIDKRIEKAGNLLGGTVEADLHTARFMVYRNASEILHGTLFGAMRLFGLTGPNQPTTKDEFQEHLQEEEIMVFLAVLFSWRAVCAALTHYKIDAPHHVADALFGRILEIPYFAERLAEA